MDYGILSIIPPLIAIAMALITKQTVISLLAGLWVGITIIFGWNPIVAIPYIFSDYVIPLMSGSFNVQLIVLIAGALSFSYMINISGGAKMFGELASKKVKTRKQAQIVTFFTAFAFIYDQPTLILGTVMRPVTEKLKVSRAKLAYICDVMGCPLSSLSPLASYGVYATGLIAAQFTALNISDDPFQAFVKAMPYNFYAIFGLLALIYVLVRTIDIGPMYEAEQRAIKTGQLIGENDNPMSRTDASDEDALKDANITIMNFVAPFTTLFVCIFGVILWNGDVVSNGVLGAFVNANAMLAITTGFFCGGAVAGIMGARSKVFDYKSIISKICKGIVVEILVVLILAWAIGAVTEAMNLKGYLITIVESTNIPYQIMPAVIFVIGAFVAFSTGSSWGVWSIMMPIAIPMAHAFGIPMSIMIGAVLGGGGFGDHCSPISDTTILASTASGADHITHVKTQLPYALVVGIASVFGFLVAGFVSPVVGFITSLVFIVIALEVLNKLTLKRVHATA